MSLKYLIREGKADITKPGDERNLYGSAFHVAALCDHVHVLEYLLTETEMPGCPDYSPMAIISA